MKIGIHNCAGQSAHYYINLGIARAFSTCGHEVYIWDHNQKSTYDFFDEFNPDIFLGHTYYVNDALIKCLKQRPFTKVLLKASDHGHINKHTDPNTPIVRCNEEELDKMFDLRLVVKDLLLYVHYHPDYLNFTHNEWGSSGYEVKSLLNAADILQYKPGNYRKEYDCDIMYFGGFWGWKGQSLSKYLYPLCSNFDYRIKVFGNSVHPVPQYCGFLPNETENDAIKSCKINLSISEPHSQQFGYDITEKPFKLAASKGFFISDYVEGLEKLFGDNIVLCKEDDFKDTVDYYLNNEKERDIKASVMHKEVLNKHTYHDRIFDILDWFDLDTTGIKETKNEIIGNWS